MFHWHLQDEGACKDKMCLSGRKAIQIPLNISFFFSRNKRFTFFLNGDLINLSVCRF